MKKIIGILGLVLCAVFVYGQKYSNGKVPTGDKSRIGSDVLRKGTKPNQILMTLGDSTVKYVDADTAAVIGKTYKVYTALLTQSGTSAPTATVLENTLGGTIVWTRDSDGIYYGTLAGLFAEPKSFILIGTYFEGVIGNTIRFGAIRYDDNTVQVTTDEAATVGTGDDGLLYFTSLEIRVYN